MSERAPGRTSVTRNDVARLAGVSPALVSYVINDSKPVSPETRAKVLQAIERLGYRPNTAARSLRLGASEMLGIVVPNTTNSFYATFAHQVQLAAADRGYALLVANSNDSAALEKRHLHHFATRGVDGVMLRKR